MRAVSVLVALAAVAAASEPETSYKLSKVLGHEFLGIGGLSGGGATSRLLGSYASDVKSDILDYLFKPNFGAALHLLKVEIGGDGQSTQGSEASHMHTADDLSCERGYEWALLQEARARNPGIDVYGLSWTWPAWTGGGPGASSPWNTPDLAANYTMQWLKCARDTYDLGSEWYIGSWNERSYSSDYLKLLRKTLDSEGFSESKIVAADRGWDIVDGMSSDPVLNASVYAIGVHYPGMTSPANARALNHPMFASEDDSTFGGGAGSGCWARILNRNYVLGQFGGTIMWNLLDAVLVGLPWYGAAMGIAHEPWSGHYEWFPALWLTAHWTQFAQPGWMYLANQTTPGVAGGSGMLSQGGSYTTLVDTQGSDWTMVIEKMHHDRSSCIRPSDPDYFVGPETATFNVSALAPPGTVLSLWHSVLRYDGAEHTLFEQLPNVIVASDGTVKLEISYDEVWTLSSILEGPAKGSHATPAPSGKFPVPYTDDMNACPVNQQIQFFTDQSGSFECHPAPDGRTGMAVRQMTPTRPITWGSDVVPLSVYGADTWTDQTHQADFYIEAGSASTTYGLIGARVLGTTQARGVWFGVSQDGHYYVFCNSGDMNTPSKAVESGTVSTPIAPGTWHTLRIAVTGSTASYALDGRTLVSNSSAPSKCNAAYGFGAFGASAYDPVWVDNWATPSAVDPGTICNPAAQGLNVALWRCQSDMNTGLQWSLVPGSTANTNRFALQSDPSLFIGVSGKDPNSGYPNLALVDSSSAVDFAFNLDSTNTSISAVVDGQTYCMDSTGGSTSPGTNIELYPCTGGDPQHLVYLTALGYIELTRDQPKLCAGACF